MDTQATLDLFSASDAAAAIAIAQEREEHHHRMMRLCWPQWEGPRVENSIHGRCSVHTPIVKNLTRGTHSYHYMAPCRIESISTDGREIIAVIDYHPDSPCTPLHNGNRLRLKLLDVWPPVTDLIAQRDAERKTHA